MSHKVKLERFEKIISGFPKANVLVIGDIMLDHYVRGKVTRISPEAPVPVVHVTSENLMPGGAANVAMNLRALSVNTSIIGTVGEDIHGHSLKLELKKAHINTQGVTRLENIQTTKKTRVIAHSQQIVRFDYETPRDLTGEDEKKMNIEGDKTVKDILQMMEIPTETVVVKKNHSIIIEEEPVENGDVIEVIKVIYGG